MGFATDIRVFGHNSSGATAVETALIAPIVVFTLIAVLEIGVLGMMNSALDHAVVTSSRMIRTGRTDAPATADAFKDAICARMGQASASCRARLAISVKTYTRFTDAQAVMTAQPDGTFSRGKAGDIVVVKANFKWPLLGAGLLKTYPVAGPVEVIIGSRTAFKNEPY